jgi:hypothetical protein
MVKKLISKALATIRSNCTAESLSIDEAFPTVEKQVLIGPEKVDTPETRHMEFSDFYSHLDGPTYRTPAVYSTMIDDVLFCPTNNCITTQSREVIRESAGPGAKVFNVHAPSILYVDRVETIDGICVPFRCTFDNYYHCLVDHLSRFDLLNHSYFTKFDEIKLLCPNGLRPEEEYFVTKLCPSNVKVVPLKKGVLYQLETYLFNSFPTQRGSAYIPGPFVKRLKGKIDPDKNEDLSKRIYISRADATKRQVLNENELIARLVEYGFQSYRLSNMQPDKQAELFFNADTVIAPHGAGLSNLLFADSVKVFELHPSRTVATHFFMLSKRMGHEYNFICHDAENADSDFYADIDQIIKQMCEA